MARLQPCTAVFRSLSHMNKCAHFHPPQKRSRTHFGVIQELSLEPAHAEPECSMTSSISTTGAREAASQQSCAATRLSRAV